MNEYICIVSLLVSILSENVNGDGLVDSFYIKERKFMQFKDFFSVYGLQILLESPHHPNKYSNQSFIIMLTYYQKRWYIDLIVN